MKLNVVLRTCDRHSLQNTRIVNKRECIIRCLNSLLSNLENLEIDKTLTIIDDNSSDELKNILSQMTENIDYVSIIFLPERNQDKLSSKKKSRFSLEVALDEIYKFEDEDLVYLVEDDYLHKDLAITEMIQSFQYLENLFGNLEDIGIFPEDFNQLYYHKIFPYFKTYVKECLIIPCPSRYYKTTWFTHESFMIKARIFKENRNIFDSLLTIGDNTINWEGNTISNLWMRKNFKMFNPIGSLIIHLSDEKDIPFYITEKEVLELWQKNKTSWSSEQDSQVAPLLDLWQKQDIM